MPVVIDIGFGVALPAHPIGDLGPADLPGVAQAQPLVRHLHLPAVPDLLVEDAEFVADAVADGRNLQGVLYSKQASQMKADRKCPNCSGELTLAGKGVIKCPFCGSEVFLAS